MNIHKLKKPKVIIFDWDGTLADSRDAIVKSMNIVLKHYNKDEWDVIKKTHRDPNKSLKENFPNLFGADAKAAYEMYLETYLKVYKDHLKTVAFAEEFLQRVTLDNSIKLAIISNKEKSLLLLEKEALYKHINFFKILGNGDTAENKPSAMPIFAVVNDLGFKPNPDDVWMIGDGKPDLDCACNAGCRPIIIGKGDASKFEYFRQKAQENKDFLWCQEGFQELNQLFEDI